MGRSHDLATGVSYQDQTETDARYHTKTASNAAFVAKAGDTMTGALTVGGNLTVNTDADTSILFKDGGTNAAFITANTGDELYVGANNEYAFRIKNDGTKDVAFDNGGRVTMPSQPMFGAYNYSGTTTAIGGYNPMLWANVHTNVGNHFNNSTGKFTFPVSGKYIAFCNINYKAADANWSGLHMLYNTSVQMASWSQNNAGTQYDNIIISTIVSASANDTLAFCWHNSYTAPDTNASYNMAYMYLLG